MTIFTDIERLITEHGSTAILRERIALAAEMYAFKEQQLVAANERALAAELRITKLEAEKEQLRLELEKAKIQIQNFENRKTAQVRLINS